MIVSDDFLIKLKEFSGFEIYEVPKNNNVFEFVVGEFNYNNMFISASHIVELDIDNELINNEGITIGYFGIDFIYKKIAFYLK